MDFDFTPEQVAFLEEVETFLDEHDDPDVFDVTRENMAQIVDTPKRRAFMAELGKRGWLGITWPEEYGGQDGEGFYEYLLNESLARRGGPQIGKGVGIIGKTLIRHGNERLKKEFLPKILRNEVEFAVGYSEPNAGSDAASMQLKAVRDGDGWLLNGQKTWTTSAHFAEWYWLGARTDPNSKHQGITLFLVKLDQPGITIKPIWTMGDERTNEVYLEDVWVSDDYVVGELNHGFQYISEALDLERFTNLASVRVQALRHRAVAEARRRLDGHRGTGQPVACADRGRADGREIRVDLSLHSHRHDRWRRIRDSEEHHRQAQAGPAEEFLSAADRGSRGRGSSAWRSDRARPVDRGTGIAMHQAASGFRRAGGEDRPCPGARTWRDRTAFLFVRGGARLQACEARRP
jgi:alkylation response protein AidB-like acyl-CoA dehydrogenase